MLALDQIQHKWLKRNHASHPENPALENIRINKVVGNRLFQKLETFAFGDPYRSGVYQAALDTIDEKLGRKKGTFDSLKKQAREILKQHKIPVYSKASPFGFNINEIAGVTGSAKSGEQFSQYIDIMEGNLNTKTYAVFNKAFEKFEGKTSLFGIRVDDFKAVMDSAGKNDVIDLQLDTKKLLVSISGSLNMKYKVGLLENSEVNQPVPRCSYKSKISIQPNTLSRILTNLEKISDNILINSSSGQVEFSGQGDYGDGKINIDSRDFEMNDLDSQEKITANYSLEYMIKVIRSIGKASKMVNLEYDTQKPMHLSFDMPSATKVEYYLAPRVQ